MSSPTSRHHIDTKRLLYPLIGMRNAKHFERLHKRASTMKKISTPKHLRATLTSHLEHNEHGLDAKKVFFDTVRKRLNGVNNNNNNNKDNNEHINATNDVVRNNVLASLMVALTSKKVLFANINGKDCFTYRLVPTLLRMAQDHSLIEENTNMAIHNAAPKLAFCILCVLCCEAECAELESSPEL